MDNYENYDVTEEQWKRIQPLLPLEYTEKKGRPGNENNSTHAIELMSMTDIAGSNLLGDKAYGTKEILA